MSHPTDNIVDEDRNDLAWWFPRLLTSGVPVPKTEIIRTDIDLDQLLDGKEPDGYGDLIDDIQHAAEKVNGFPVFLRTGHTSGKHSWNQTCYLDGYSGKTISNHIVALVEFSAMADFLGLSTRTWVVREFLPLWSTFTAFDGIPVAVERRLFLRDGKCECDHPYWPHNSIINPSRNDWSLLLNDHVDIVKLYDSQTQVKAILAKVAPAFPGYWSMDCALCRDGRWVVTDMAEGERSFHWPRCRFSPKRQQEDDPPRAPIIVRKDGAEWS